MYRRPRTGRRLLKALLPVALLIVLALVAFAAWVVYGATHPPRRAYLVTPEKFGQLSARGLKATDETWSNRDGTRARGWLLRGAEGAPAVVLLHRYGADRSWVLNLGVKLNESSNFTVLLPDLRGHGETPLVAANSFGSREAEDVSAAIDYLRSLTTAQGRPLVGRSVGLYGAQLGAYAALLAARHDPGIAALVLDSVPASPDELLGEAVKTSTGMDNGLLRALARLGARVYFLSGYHNIESCVAARDLKGRRVLLLSGEDAGSLRASTDALASCFGGQSEVEVKTDLPLTGSTLAYSTGEQGETYDRRVIEYFSRNLSGDK
ncbi:MAG TPA: alpha/beta hydrolase [Pyrinomonadaceae bacterium]|nr:alpha/beta hydrolase [Pyrinomonadaceae bacterium]